MVHYLGVEGMQRLVARLGVDRLLQRLGQAIADDYRRWPAFLDPAPRQATHVPGGVLEVMPLCDGRHYAVKVVNGHPGNPVQGKLTVTAVGLLLDAGTGYPLLVADMTLATALRTAATSALAAGVLARPDSTTMAVLGNGAQAEFQVLALHQALGLTTMRLFDPDPQASAKLLRNLGRMALPGLSACACASVAEAVRGADVVTSLTAAKRHGDVLQPEMIVPGMHLNAVGGDCPGKTELHPDILSRPDLRVVVEFEAQSRIEGEIQRAPSACRPAPLWQVLRGELPGRQSEAQVTLFDSVGFALEDFSTLVLLHRLLQDQPDATRLDLTPEPADPKDLYSVLCPPASGATSALRSPP